MFATIRANLLACVLGLAAAIFMVIAVVQNVEIHGFLWIDGLNDKVETLKRDNNELRFAAKEAKRLNDEQVARIEREQQEITNEVQSDLNARLERLRSELRSKAAQGSAGRPQASPDGKATPGVVGEAGVCLAPEELLRAAENEERHDQLITWVEKQLGVER